MPLYEYQCDGTCGRRFEIIVKFSDPPVEKCPTCGGPVHKLFSSPAIQFKGSGWYITDYAKKDQASGGKSDSNASSASESKDAKETKDTKAAAEKPDKPAEKKSTGDTSTASTSSTTTPSKKD
jgi:putative FmdB family regulatory protein